MPVPTNCVAGAAAIVLKAAAPVIVGSSTTEKFWFCSMSCPKMGSIGSRPGICGIGSVIVATFCAVGHQFDEPLARVPPAASVCVDIAKVYRPAPAGHLDTRAVQ